MSPCPIPVDARGLGINFNEDESAEYNERQRNKILILCGIPHLYMDILRQFEGPKLRTQFVTEVTMSFFPQMNYGSCTDRLELSSFIIQFSIQFNKNGWLRKGTLWKSVCKSGQGARHVTKVYPLPGVAFEKLGEPVTLQSGLPHVNSHELFICLEDDIGGKRTWEGQIQNSIKREEGAMAFCVS